MQKFAKNYEANLRYTNNSGSMFVKSSCHDRIANTDTCTSRNNMSVTTQKDELRIGRIGAFDDIV